MMATAEPAERRVLGRHGSVSKATAAVRYVGSPPKKEAEEAVLRQFVDSRYQSKRDIALLLVLRSWRGMAEASQLRREELVAMWREAFVFRRRTLMRRALDTLRGAAARRMQRTDYQYEQVQLKLAAMHYRQLLLRRVFDRLGYAGSLQLRLQFWNMEQGQKTIYRCWDEWRTQLAHRRALALEEAATIVSRRSEQRLLAGALDQWRTRAYEPAAIGRIVEERHDDHVVRQALRVWHMLAKAARFAQAQRTRPVQATLTHWRDATGKQHQRRALEAEQADEAEMIRTADDHYYGAQMSSVLEQLFSASQQHVANKMAADRFWAYMRKTQVLTEWQHHSHARRSDVLQSRTLRDWEREHNRKRRHVILQAWHKIAIDSRRNEQRADLLNERRASTAVRQCLGHWLDEYRTRTTTGNLHTGNLHTGPLAHVDAQTMTSFQIGQPERPDSAERRELVQRVRRAEEEASRARALLTGSKDTLLARAAQDELLEARTAQWQQAARGRLLRAVLKRLGVAAAQARHARTQQTARLEDAAARMHDIQLRKALRAWRSTAQLTARLTAQADALYYDRLSLGNREVMVGALRSWRARLKQVRQLHMAADKSCAVRAARRLFDTLAARRADTEQMMDTARGFWRALQLTHVWTRLLQEAGRRAKVQPRRDLRLPSDQDALQALDAGSPVVPLDVGADLDEIDTDILRLYFSAWLDVVKDMQALQGAAIEKLPHRLQCRALETTGDFEWGLVHDGHLMRTSIARWRSLAARRPAPVVDDGCDPRRAAQLIALEARVRATVQRNAAKQAVQRWMVVMRGKLLEDQLPRAALARVVAVVAARVRQVAEARRLDRERVLRTAVRQWWAQCYVIHSRLENAAVQADGTLARACVLQWAGRTHSRQEQARSRRLYTKAVAFRWEKQARRALTQWMHRSTDCRIRARLAQQAGPQRELQLQAVADQWRRERMARSALDRLRSAARLRALQHDMLLRFAAAWGDANIQRHALAAWRTRTSPPGSMFFSVVAGAD